MTNITILSAASYLALLNIATFSAFAWDRRCARTGRWRVMESTLLGMVAAGGTVGAFFAQRWLKHKTRKEPFQTRLLLIASAQVLALGVISIPAAQDGVFLVLDQEVSASVR